MEYREIAYDVADRVATITLDRPEALNAFTTVMLREMLHAFDRIDADDDVRAVIVTGRGRGFCAGADLSAGADTFNDDRGRNEPGRGADRGANEAGGVAGRANEAACDDDRQRPVPRDGGGRLALRIFACHKPVIAAVNGPAVGVGVTMTLPMDVRLASESARFGFVFARRGIVPEACSSWFLPRVVGISQAAEWVYTGRVFPADEALRGGLIRSVHPPDDLLPAARALAGEMASGTAPVSVALSRQLLWRMLGAAHPMEAHRADSRGISIMGRSADVREGVESFLEKRAPAFPGKVSADLPDLFPEWEEPDFR